MRRTGTLLAAAVVAAALILAVAAPSGAITFGQPDGNRHSYAGALLADWDPDSAEPDVFCSGTLIAARVFLTAGHCTSFFEEQGISPVGVTFDPAYDEDAASPAGIFSGTVVTHPDFGFSGPGGASDPHDLAVVVLDVPPGIAPAELPTEACSTSWRRTRPCGARRSPPSATAWCARRKPVGRTASCPSTVSGGSPSRHSGPFSPRGSVCRNNRRPATPAPASVIPGDLISWAARQAIYWCRSRSFAPRGIR
jgi:hypothetical protein